MFDRKRPCVGCPFRRGQGSQFRMSPERLEEIRTGPAFQCHKTLDGNRPQQCAGLMAVLRREGDDNQIMQVAARLGAAEFGGLDPRGEAYASWAEVQDAHEGKTG